MPACRPTENPYQYIPRKFRLMRCDAGVCLSVRRWLPPLLWAGVILVITSLPGSAVPSALAPYDKVVHFGMYGVFAASLAHQAMPQMGAWRGMFIALALG